MFKSCISCLVFLIFFIQPSLSFSNPTNQCSFEIPFYKTALKASNDVPLIVKNSFDKGIIQALEKRFIKNKERFSSSLSLAENICPVEYKRAHAIWQKLIDSYSFSTTLRQPPELVVLCSKKKMDPISRNLGGRYLLVPYSLVDKKVSDNAVAAVLSHELAHTTLRHHARLIDQVHNKKSKLIDTKFRHEIEADLTGLQIAVQAGFSSKGVLSHLKEVHAAKSNRQPPQSENYGVDGLAVHESFEKRIARLEEQIRKCHY